MKRSWTLLAVAWVALVVGGDTGSRSNWTTVRDTISSGTVHVTNIPAANTSPIWTLVEALRVGSLEGTGPDAFAYLKGLVALDVVHATAPAVHRDSDTGRRQAPGEGEAGELAALIGIENLRLAMASQRLIESLDAKARVQGVRQPPSQHMPTRPIHDRHQVKEASAHRDIGDVGAPDLIGPVDRHALEQIRVDPVLGMRITGAWRPVDRLKPHQAHQTTGPAATDAHTLKAQMTRPSGGLRRTDASGTTHRCAALAQGSPHSRPWACNRARIARSIANGIDGSNSAQGEGASPISRSERAPKSKSL